MDPHETIAPEPRKTLSKLLSRNVPMPASEMDRSLINSLAWRAAGDWISQIFSWASLLIIVRLLTPADFGIIGMAVILFPYLRYISEFGIPRAIITLPNLTEDQIAQLNTIALSLGLGTFGISIALARPLALFFRTPALTPVVMVTCLALIPMGTKAASEGVLLKEMRFRLLSWYDVISATAAALVTLLLAWLGMGYWALAIGNLSATVVRTGMVLYARPHRFALPRLDTIREPLRFGWQVLVSAVALNSYQRLDNVTAGRVLGQTALGFYGMAWTLANVPLEKFTSLVTNVLPTYLAAVQKQPAALRRYLRVFTETVALVTFPAAIGLGLVARELIPLALGQRWIGVIPPLEVLSVYAAFRSIMALLSKVLTAVGSPGFVMWNELLALAVLPVAFWLGSHWGTEGIAWGWVLAYPIVAIPLYRRTFQTIGMKAGEYLRALRPAFDSTGVMLLGVGFLKLTIPASKPLIVRLVLEILTGAVLYIATLVVLHRKRTVALLGLVKKIRQA